MSQPLAPGATIGIVGGGQLGRMLAMAAARLGYFTVVLEPDEECPAGDVASHLIVAAMTMAGLWSNLPSSVMW